MNATEIILLLVLAWCFIAMITALAYGRWWRALLWGVIAVVAVLVIVFRGEERRHRP